jgi:hypothetical protein
MPARSRSRFVQEPGIRANQALDRSFQILHPEGNVVQPRPMFRNEFGDRGLPVSGLQQFYSRLPDRQHSYFDSFNRYCFLMYVVNAKLIGVEAESFGQTSDGDTQVVDVDAAFGPR